MTQQHAEGLVILPDVVFTKDSGRLAELALLHLLPSIYVYRPFVIAGGLMAYGPDLYLALDLATQYVDKIIKGESPSKLPVQQPTRFKLAINLKTAKSLGLTLPRELLLRADVDDVIRQ
jgi:putative ABC transport system substrate-binding protein